MSDGVCASGGGHRFQLRVNRVTFEGQEIEERVFLQCKRCLMESDVIDSTPLPEAMHVAVSAIQGEIQ